MASDIYASGLQYVDNVLMSLAASSEMDERMRFITTKLMMLGFDHAVKGALDSVVCLVLTRLVVSLKPSNVFCFKIRVRHQHINTSEHQHITIATHQHNTSTHNTSTHQHINTTRQHVNTSTGQQVGHQMGGRCVGWWVHFE